MLYLPSSYIYSGDMAKSKEFIVEGIKTLLRRNYNIDSQTIDVWALVDSTLTFGENWTIIKEEILINREKYSLLRCKRCNKIVRGDWNYCCKCGFQLNDSTAT
jgi:hypothetical protein